MSNAYIYEVNYTDPDTGATSTIEVIEAGIFYTAENYIEDCREYADEEQIEMLERGKVTLNFVK